LCYFKATTGSIVSALRVIMGLNFVACSVEAAPCLQGKKAIGAYARDGSRDLHISTCKPQKNFFLTCRVQLSMGEKVITI
jgi:hypothetical protein